MSKYGDVWDARRTRLREHVSRLIPVVLTEYPFEVLASVLGVLIGLPLLLGLAAPTSLVLLLPTVIYWAYAVALVLGGATTGLGLKTRHPMVLASGLQLLGGSFCVYGLAVAAVSGFAIAWLSFGAYAFLGLLALIRAHHFRRLLDIQKGATALRQKDSP